MNIQIFGVNNDFETKKAERYFKERGIKYQFINLKEKEMSYGEFSSVCNCVNVNDLINKKAKDKTTLSLMEYLSDEDKKEKLFEQQNLLQTPIVRNGKKAIVGYKPEIYKKWSEEE